MTEIIESEVDLGAADFINCKDRGYDCIFTGGVYCSGKTTLAKKIADGGQYEYIDFDKTYDYDKASDNAYNIDFFNKLPFYFVMDAVPWNKYIHWFAKVRNIKIICVYCSDATEWLHRVKQRKVAPAQDHLYIYAGFYYRILPMLTAYNISFFDTSKGEVTSLEEMYKRISWLSVIFDKLY